MTDPQAVERLLGPLDPPMAVVTTTDGRERAGCLVGFHCQCSMEPARYAVWISKANHTFRVGMLAERFAVHFLGADQLDVARLFGGETGDDVDKFGFVAWEADAAGVPLLRACPQRFVGRRTTLLDDGSDHVCVVLEPISVAAGGPGFTPLRISAVAELRPGHRPGERPRPADERARPPG